MSAEQLFARPCLRSFGAAVKATRRSLQVPRSRNVTNCFLAFISGLALAASFPSLNLDLLAWLAFVPLLYAFEGQPYLTASLVSIPLKTQGRWGIRKAS
jgi:apolipoprotein N-acyltransferase